METKVEKMVKNVDPRWISMRNQIQCIISEYNTLLVKMGLDASSGQKTTGIVVGNFSFFLDIEVIFSLALLILMLNVVHSLIKLIQARDIFVCDFMQSIKIYQVELGRMFIDPSSVFSRMEFACYNELVQLKSADVPLEWRDLDSESGICHLESHFNVVLVDHSVLV